MRKKRCATGGSVDPYSMLAAKGTELIGDYGAAFNYKPQLGPEKTQGDYNKEIILKGITGGGISAIPSIIRMMKDKNTTVFGSPGTYQQGGPIQVNPRPKKAGVNNLAQWQVTQAGLQMLNPNVLPELTGGIVQDNSWAVPQAIPLLNNVGTGFPGGGSSKSKSKDRFREKATGGPVDPIEPLRFLGRSYTKSPETWNVSKHPSAGDHDVKMNVIPENKLNLKGIRTQSTDKTPYMSIGDNIYYNPYDSIYVARQQNGSYKEIPETATIDGNQDAGIRNYSQKIIENPYFDLGDSYRLRGNVSQHLEKYPKQNKATGGKLDQQLSNTSFQVKGNPNVTDGNSYPELNAKLDHNEVVDENAKFVFSDDLELGDKSFAKRAKPLYSAIGKLESRKDPISTATTQQLNKQIETLAMTQEQLATALGLRDNQSMGRATGGPLPWDGFGVKEFQQWANEHGYVDPVTKKPLKVDNSWGPSSQAAFNQLGTSFAGELGISKTPNGFKRTSPQVINNNPQGMSIPVGTDQYLDADVNRPTWMAPKAPSNRPVYIDTPEGQVDISGLESRDPRTETARDRAQRIILPDGTAYNPSGTPEAQIGTLDTSLLKASTTDRSSTGFTAGDIMQGIEVGSKFFNIAQGAEKERQILNTTPVTRTGYDNQAALYQNQRNFQNTVNGIGTSSPNTRRALVNSLYATKLNADNQVITNYQNMNNEATINYENRLSAQRQGNMAAEFRTNDLNAANRGVYDQAQQNAFTSVGNFGEAINRRKMSLDALKLLRARYPEIYDDVMSPLK